jgi:hypothetical protein
MSRDTLIDAIKELIDQWHAKADQLRKDENPRAFDFEECADELNSILPPEE